MRARAATSPMTFITTLLAAVLACRTGAQQGASAADKAAPSKPKPCASTTECPEGHHCTVEDGACNRPPGCGPNDICAQVCWGVCAAGKKKAEKTGEGTVAPQDGGACKTDEECRAFSDYCDGCACRALRKDDKDPVCRGRLVACFTDPCMNKIAACEKGRCALRAREK